MAAAPSSPLSTRALSDLTFASFDVETTGLDASRERIVEIAVVRTNADGQVLGEYTTLVNPQGAVSGTRIHGISENDVLAAPTFAQLSPRFLNAMAGAVAVAHNAVFDIGFVAAEQGRLGAEIRVPYICTKELRALVGLPGTRWLSLANSCQEEGIALHDAHSALADARATAQLLNAYLQRARALGATTLSDLLTLGEFAAQPIFSFSWQHTPLEAPAYYSRLFTKLPRS
jgi:DNA polymerase-3 subunit epsilon